MRIPPPQLIFSAGLLVLVVLLLAAPQGQRLAYNPNTETTIEGIVQEVQNYYCPLSSGEGTHLVVATENELVRVHFAPQVFLRSHDWSFLPGDRVQVIGSKISYGPPGDMVARKVSRYGLTVSVRAQDGKPVWTD
jgi:hypothetical protein